MRRAGLALAAAAFVLAARATAAGEDAPKVERKLAKAISKLALSPDGKWVAAADETGALTLFSTSDAARREATPRVGAPPRQIVFTADSGLVVAAFGAPGKGGRSLRVYSIDDGNEVRSMQFPAKPFDPAELWEVRTRTGSCLRLHRTGKIDEWDAATGKLVESRPNEPLSFSRVDRADGTLSAYASTSELRVVDATGAAKWTKDLKKEPSRGGRDVMEASFDLCGFGDGGRALLILSKSNEFLPSMETKEVRRLQARSAADGALLWKRDVSEDVFPDQIAVGAVAVAVVDQGKLAFLSAAKGEPVEWGRTDVNYTCVAATADGLAFWAGLRDGRVVLAKTSPAPKGK